MPGRSQEQPGALPLFRKRPFDAHHRQQQESWRFAALNCSITRAKNCDQKTPVAG
jgi:hypothetical protein